MAGCESGPSESDKATGLAKAYVARNFKDPDSVMFRDLKVILENGKPNYVCGEANAKNGFGAYVGYEKFYGTVEGSGASMSVKFMILQSQAERSGGVFFFPYQCK